MNPELNILALIWGASLPVKVVMAILILFWQPSLVLGVLIDAVLLIAVLGLHWQPWITG